MSIFREPGSGRGRGRTAGLLAAGVLLGVGGVLAFNTALEATSTDEFCLGCHNHAIPYRQHQLTAHYKNPYGVVAGCSDCHVQQEFLPKMTRKIEAAREVWGHLRGVIDTDEKYLAHQPEMKERELARFRASDSATCRSCHTLESMDLNAQDRIAARRHRSAMAEGKACIACHKALVHKRPRAPEAAPVAATQEKSAAGESEPAAGGSEPAAQGSEPTAREGEPAAIGADAASGASRGGANDLNSSE